MNAQAKTYKVKSSASRAAKKALGHDNFEVVETSDGSFVYNDLTAAPAANEQPEQPPVDESSLELEQLTDTAEDDIEGTEDQGVQVDDAPEATPEQVAAIEQAGDNAANGLTVTEAPAGEGKPKLDVLRASTIEKPTKKVWAFAESILADEPNIRRKDMIDRLVAKGIAFYTARTQYQLYLAAVKAQNAPPAPAAADSDDGEE